MISVLSETPFTFPPVCVINDSRGSECDHSYKSIVVIVYTSDARSLLNVLKIRQVLASPLWLREI